MNMRIAALAAMLVVARIAGGQTPAEHVALGDKEQAAMNLTASLRHYEAAMNADPANYEAMWKAARDAVDLGEFNPSAEERTRLYKSAELYARRAVQTNPQDAEGHFHLARSIGRNAQTMGTRDKIKYAGEVRAQALEALKINPKHGGALHVMGVWNAEVMRLSGFSRMIARNFLGGKVFGSANWNEARRYMEESVAAEPNRIVHHLDLARVYADIGEKDKARAEYQQVLRMPVAEFNDRAFKSQAEDALKSLE
jgi:tetratricopeptide (TPR) repeat protein